MASKIHTSLGPTGFWGYSATFDFLEALLRATKGGEAGDAGAGSDAEPIKILLVHPGDVRHILTTVSRRQRHHGTHSRLKPFRPIHFYLLENPMEVLSRNLLLLEAVNDYEVPIRQRASIFLEIFGNGRVQDRTARYIEQLGQELRTFLASNSGGSSSTSSSSSGRLEGILDLSYLKYREKDDLEATFKCYSRSTPFDIENYRDHRMRGYYEERYDSRKNLADWDYHQQLKTRASIIHIKQFKDWRVTGIGFELGDQVYTEPNRTLISYVDGVIKKGKEKGERKGVLGYWGDIVGGPFFSFGVDSDVPNTNAEGLYEILNKNTGTEQHRHHTVEISLYNLFSVLWEMETGQVYQMKKKNDIYSGLGAEAGLLPDPDAKKGAEAEESSDVVVELGPIYEEGEGEEWEKEKEKEEPEKDTTADSDEPATVFDSLSEVTQSLSGPSAAEEEELAKAIQRAECIVQTWRDVKVFPLVGNPSAVLDKPRFHGMFDAVFVSARAASCVEHDWFAKLVKATSSLVAVESSKFIVPLGREQKAEFTQKEEAFAAKHEWSKLNPAPVFRRRRDENDTEDDVLFFRP